MLNNYLQILGLDSGASEKEIKNAYRRLAKQYHPDLNENEEAREQFLKVTEAYKFLMEVGPRPDSENIRYDYNPHQKKYDEWREQAKAFARRKAAEKALYQQNLLDRIYLYFNYVTAVALAINFIIIIDSLLPAESHQQRVLGVKELHYKPFGAAHAMHMYDEVIFTSFKLRVEKNTASDIRDNRAVVLTSPLLNFIKRAEVQVGREVKKLYPEYGIYYILRFLIPIVIVFGIAYYFLDNRHINKITVLVVVSALTLMEIALIISFRY